MTSTLDKPGLWVCASTNMVIHSCMKCKMLSLQNFWMFPLKINFFPNDKYCWNRVGFFLKKSLHSYGQELTPDKTFKRLNYLPILSYFFDIKYIHCRVWKVTIKIGFHIWGPLCIIDFFPCLVWVNVGFLNQVKFVHFTKSSFFE